MLMRCRMKTPEDCSRALLLVAAVGRSHTMRALIAEVMRVEGKLEECLAAAELAHGLHGKSVARVAGTVRGISKFKRALTRARAKKAAKTRAEEEEERLNWAAAEGHAKTRRTNERLDKLESAFQKAKAARDAEARHDSAEDFSRLNALLCTAMGWVFIPAYCFANS